MMTNILQDQEAVPGAGHLLQLNAEGAAVVAAMDLQAGFLVLDNEDPYLLVQVVGRFLHLQTQISVPESTCKQTSVFNLRHR